MSGNNTYNISGYSAGAGSRRRWTCPVWGYRWSLAGCRESGSAAPGGARSRGFYAHPGRHRAVQRLQGRKSGVSVTGSEGL